MTCTERLIVPGWKKLAAAADKKWGNSSRTIITNEKEVSIHIAFVYDKISDFYSEYPENPATICIGNKPVDIAVNGQCRCIGAAIPNRRH